MDTITNAITIDYLREMMNNVYKEIEDIKPTDYTWSGKGTYVTLNDDYYPIGGMYNYIEYPYKVTFKPTTYSTQLEEENVVKVDKKQFEELCTMLNLVSVPGSTNIQGILDTIELLLREKREEKPVEVKNEEYVPVYKFIVTRDGLYFYVSDDGIVSWTEEFDKAWTFLSVSDAEDIVTKYKLLGYDFDKIDISILNTDA